MQLNNTALLNEKAVDSKEIKINKSKQWIFIRSGWVLITFVVALLLRIHAAQILPTASDEPDYLRAAEVYAQYIAAGDISGIINDRTNYEHPPMSKIAFGVIMFEDNDYTQVVRRTETAIRDHHQRIFSAVVGALTAAAVAFVSPLAGLLVAFNAWHIEYTSEMMLEALPCLFSALMLLLLRRSKANGDRYFWAAAVFLGLTAAGKYIYAVAGFAALIWLLWRNRNSWKIISAWVGVALLAFYIADPVLWPDPFGRLWASITFNFHYTTTTDVTSSGYGLLQPFVWLLTEPTAPTNHLHTFPLPLNAIIAALTFTALPWLWRKERLLFWWIAVDLFFLLLWPTKWSQYIVILTVPLALAVALWVQFLATVIFVNRRGIFRQLKAIVW